MPGDASSTVFDAPGAFTTRVANSLDRLRDGPYLSALRFARRERYLTALVFSGLLALVIVWYASGRIDLSWRPEIPGNRVDAELNMPVDASVKETLAVIRRIEAAALRAVDRLGDRDQHVEQLVHPRRRGQRQLR